MIYLVQVISCNTTQAMTLYPDVDGEQELVSECDGRGSTGFDLPIVRMGIYLPG